MKKGRKERKRKKEKRRKEEKEEGRKEGRESGKGEAPVESNTGRALGGLQLKRLENERLPAPKATLVGGGQEETCEKSDTS